MRDAPIFGRVASLAMTKKKRPLSLQSNLIARQTEKYLGLP